MSNYNIDFSMNALVIDKLFENIVLNTEDNLISTNILNNSKVIGIYFSGSYCPPCRKFTPILCDVYNQLKSLNKNIEIIFISSDKSIESFNEYYKKMPWLALPYEKRDLKKKLCDQFYIKTIPQLIFIKAKSVPNSNHMDKEFEIIHLTGRNLIEENYNNISYIINELEL